jgi:hypothetical protein
MLLVNNVWQSVFGDQRLVVNNQWSAVGSQQLAVSDQ